MAKKPIANAADRPVMLSADSARRVGRMLSAYEGGDRAITPYVTPNAYGGGGDTETRIKIGKTTTLWTKETLSDEIEIYVYDHTAAALIPVVPAETVTKCVNPCRTVKGGKWVVLASHDDESDEDAVWALVMTEGRDVDDCEDMTFGGDDLELVQGYDAGATQVLGHVAGCLQWIDTSNCPEV